MEVGIQAMGGNDTHSQDGAARREGVSFKSDTYDKLLESVKRTKENAAILSQKWEKKEEAANKTLVCKGCRKEYKTQAGLTRHWSSKKSDCTEEVGFEKVALIQPSLSDRVNSADLGIVDKAARARQAALEVQQRLSGKKGPSVTREDGFDVRRLMTYPVGNFERAIRSSKTEVLQEFVKQRFDSSTGPKKIMAQNELKRRESQGD
jgi:hypothetical protein